MSLDLETVHLHVLKLEGAIRKLAEWTNYEIVLLDLDLEPLDDTNLGTEKVKKSGRRSVKDKRTSGFVRKEDQNQTDSNVPTGIAKKSTGGLSRSRRRGRPRSPRVQFKNVADIEDEKNDLLLEIEDNLVIKQEIEECDDHMEEDPLQNEFNSSIDGWNNDGDFIDEAHLDQDEKDQIDPIYMPDEDVENSSDSDNNYSADSDSDYVDEATITISKSKTRPSKSQKPKQSRNERLNKRSRPKMDLNEVRWPFVDPLIITPILDIEPPHVVLKRLKTSTLEEHGITKDKIPIRFEFECYHCGDKFISKGRLRRHKDTLHADQKLGPFKCNHLDCSRIFKWYSSYVKHLKWHKGEFSFPSPLLPEVYRTCPQKDCSKVFPSKKEMNRHLVECHSNNGKPLRPYLCDLCGFTTSLPNCLQKHVINMHSENNSETLICDICGRQFKKPMGLKGHMQKFHVAANRYPCMQCILVFDDEDALKRHIGTTHTEGGVRKRRNQRKLPCHHCDKMFRDKCDLRRHLFRAENPFWERSKKKGKFKTTDNSNKTTNDNNLTAENHINVQNETSDNIIS